MTLAITAFPYARASGLGTSMKEVAGWWSLGVATLVTIAICAAAVQVTGSIALIGVALLTVLMAWHFTRRLSGLTGDTYGAINEVMEVAVLILIPLASGAYRVQP